MSNTIVVEDFLHPMTVRGLKREILSNREIKWTYLQHTSLTDDIDNQTKANDTDIIRNHFGTITHMLVKITNNNNIDENFQTSDIYSLFPDLKKLVETKFNIKVEKIIKCRINCAFPIGDITLKYDTPHTDYVPKNNEKTKTIICYMTDSDGDTALFNEISIDEKSHNILDRTAKKTLIERFSPKEGRAIMFDANRYHAMCFPSKKLRMVLTIIVVLDDNSM